MAEERDPKAETDMERKAQALTFVLNELRKSRPDFTEGDLQILWVQAGRGDGDWRALVLVHDTDVSLYQVGYNYDADTLYVDLVGKTSKIITTYGSDKPYIEVDGKPANV